MRVIWLVVVGGAALGGVMLAACGSDVESSGGAGGAGGAGDEVVSTTSQTVVSVSSSGGFVNTCEEACDKLDSCGATGYCDQLPFLDCDEPESECPAQCVLDAECAQLFAYVQGVDNEFKACIDECDVEETCSLCTATNCTAEVQACANNPSCAPLINCVLACTDDIWVAECANRYPSPETDLLAACGCVSLRVGLSLVVAAVVVCGGVSLVCR